MLGRLRRARESLPANVRSLGWVSFANDLASELAYPIVPLFLTITLGAPVAVVGLIEGVAEGVSVGLRGLSGWLSDREGRRKPWIVAGYSLTALSRPIIAAAPTWGWVLGARVVDRLGKAARTAPRDALINDSTPPETIGSAFGYHRAMDTAGAVVGPLVAVELLALGLSFRSVLWVTVLPALATLVLLRRVREAHAARAAAAPVERVQSRRHELPTTFWLVLGIWTVFSIGNSSDVFLLLRTHELGLGTTLAVLAYAAYNTVYCGLSWPLGALSDRVGRTLLIGAGIAVFGLVYLGFAVAPAAWAVWPLFLVYGAYIAATDGVAKAWVADYAPPELGGTAYGVFAAVSGAALLFASIAAGLLWTHVSPKAPFVLGAVSAAVSLVLLGAFELYRMRRAPT